MTECVTVINTDVGWQPRGDHCGLLLKRWIICLARYIAIKAGHGNCRSAVVLFEHIDRQVEPMRDSCLDGFNRSLAFL